MAAALAAATAATEEGVGKLPPSLPLRFDPRESLEELVTPSGCVKSACSPLAAAVGRGSCRSLVRTTEVKAQGFAGGGGGSFTSGGEFHWAAKSA